MTSKWTGWKGRKKIKEWVSPYADWNGVTGGLHAQIRMNAEYQRDGDRDKLVYPRFTQSFRSTRSNERTAGRVDGLEGSEKFIQELLEQAMNEIYQRNTTLPPVPLNTLTGCNDFDAPKTDENKLPVDVTCHFDHLEKEGPRPDVLKSGSDLPAELAIANDTVIVGIVDLGVALGHRRTRLKNGKTRFLAAWQQTAPRLELNPGPSNSGTGEQMYIPFGREMLANDINKALDKHTSGVPGTGQLDEEAFNRATYTEDFENSFGQRELAGRAAHGTHILDCAGGIDPELGGDMAERIRLMAVNLPDRALVGHSAQFLEFFAIHGILRIVTLADAIWSKNNPNSNILHRGSGKDDKNDESREGARNELVGYPLVINLSFGKQADSRDGYDLIASVLRELNKFRTCHGVRPVYLSMPAGNENLERGNIRTRIMPGAELSFDWRVHPEDQSANFVEIWSKGLDIKAGYKAPLAIEVTTPGGVSSGLSGGKGNQVNDYMVADELVARIYSRIRGQKDLMAERDEDESSESVCREGGRPDTNRRRVRYVIATRQTQLYESGPLAPAGVWRIKLRNDSTRPMSVDISVQTDQSERSESPINRRSYFEVAEYRGFDETGRVIDSYSYPLDASAPKITDVSNVVRRHGTINAIGLENVTAIGAGHRRTDGRMEPYSGTGIHRRENEELAPSEDDKSTPVFRQIWSQPTASMPTRDGAAHFGTLASGARDGSVIALQGTSFAAAKITRRIAELLSSNNEIGYAGVISEIEDLAKDEEKRSGYSGQVAVLKAGAGRMVPHPDNADLARFDRLGRK